MRKVVFTKPKPEVFLQAEAAGVEKDVPALCHGAHLHFYMQEMDSAPLLLLSDEQGDQLPMLAWNPHGAVHVLYPL